MKVCSYIAVVAIAIGVANAAAINIEQRDLATSSTSGLSSVPVYNRGMLQGRAVSAATIESEATTASQKASTGLKQATASMKALDVNTVTAEQMKPIIAQITSAITPASHTFTSLAAQAKSINSNSKRQNLNTAVDELVTDLNTTLKTLAPLVSHLTANLDLGTVQDLVIALTPTLTTLILGVEGLLTGLAPGLSTIVDPLLTTVYGLTDALGLNLNLPAPSS